MVIIQLLFTHYLELLRNNRLAHAHSLGGSSVRVRRNPHSIGVCTEATQHQLNMHTRTCTTIMQGLECYANLYANEWLAT